jgi:hypothetical protein
MPRTVQVVVMDWQQVQQQVQQQGQQAATQDSEGDALPAGVRAWQTGAGCCGWRCVHVGQSGIE